MKTTVDIPDPLFRKIKRLAARQGMTMKLLLIDALRRMLEEADGGAPPGEFRFRTFEGRGLQPGLSWGEMDKVLDTSYEGRGA